MDTPAAQGRSDHEPDDFFGQHVRASCGLAETLAARIEVEGVEALVPRIRRAWVEAELPSRCPEAWATIWRAVATADPARVMSRRERRALAALPPVVTAYRGFGGEGARGWSWTLERDMAEDFAVRYEEGIDAEARLCIAEVDTSAVIALLLLGDESELIIDPDEIDWERTRIEACAHPLR
ncbi:hypothetical protein [Kytococcus sedentarius]|uniref:hypothetical protein n=1 Tax=Kytococcus sedentarius TaxID=1276 RepID=UPI0035BC32D7